MVRWILLVFAVLGSLVIFGLVTPFTPPVPPPWHRVHAGMQRSNILALVGAPTISGYPEKIVGKK